MWKLNLLPQEAKFFELFDESAANVVEGARLLVDLVEDFRDVPEKARKLFACEHHGDKITHHILKELSQTFVTPMDREDIQALADRLDDVLDLMEQAGDRLDLYAIKAPTAALLAQVRILLRAAEALRELVKNLPNLRDAASFEAGTVQVHDIENEGDRATRLAISELFTHDVAPADIIKWKDIYEDVEAAIDKCDDAANVIQTIVLKHA